MVSWVIVERRIHDADAAGVMCASVDWFPIGSSPSSPISPSFPSFPLLPFTNPPRHIKQ